MPLFAVFDDARLMKLAQAVKEEVFQGGNVILQKGESGDTMYIIKQGSVRCTDIGHGMTRGCTLDVSYITVWGVQVDQRETLCWRLGKCLVSARCC